MTRAKYCYSALNSTVLYSHCSWDAKAIGNILKSKKKTILKQGIIKRFFLFFLCCSIFILHERVRKTRVDWDQRNVQKREEKKLTKT